MRKVSVCTRIRPCPSESVCCLTPTESSARTRDTAINGRLSAKAQRRDWTDIRLRTATSDSPFLRRSQAVTMLHGRHCYMSMASAKHCKANDDWVSELSWRIESEYEFVGRFRSRDGHAAFSSAVDVGAGALADGVGEGWRELAGGLGRAVQDEGDCASGAG